MWGILGTTATNGSLGNLPDDGVRTYGYDDANRLIAVVSGTLTTTYTYNGDGHRVGKTENGETTSYVVAVLGLSQVLVETTAGESILYLYGHDLLGEESTTWAWHLGDGLGSVRQLADSGGGISLAQGYTPFGVPLWSEGGGTTGYGFTGERWEAYSQLLFLRARYYDPGIGGLVSRDPWPGSDESPQTSHGWSYVESNPINRIDPSGYFSDEAIVRSLEGLSLNEAFGRGELGRWGLFALLRDAVSGDRLLMRYADFDDHGSYYYPLASDPDQEWIVNCEVCSQEVVFSNPRRGDHGLSLNEFLHILDGKARAASSGTGANKWWRQQSLEFHWYELIRRYGLYGDLYSDWAGLSELPDLLLWKLGAEIKGGIGGGVSFIRDRYGNQYWSISVGPGFVADVTLLAWEGYATGVGPLYKSSSGHHRYYERASEGELKDILEGSGLSYTAVSPFAGVGLDISPIKGLILLYGGTNPSMEFGASIGWTWYDGKDRDKDWSWVDKRIPSYDSSIRNHPNPPGPVTCGCE